MSQSSAAMALRESFGDRKLPEISRKITACVACRKLKIKCHMNASNPPCSRCKARGLSCTINKSLQMLLENDASWREAMEERIDKIEEALMHGSNQNHSCSSADIQISSPRPNALQDAIITKRRPGTASVHQVIEESRGATLNLSCSLGAFPASSIINLALADERVNGAYRPDLVSCSLISLETAEGYFAFYQKNLNPYIHHILAENDSLPSVRAKSSLLTAAICTVASLCTNSKDYQRCLKAFMNEVSCKLFSARTSFDDVRALCIGALWLNDISSALSGLAVRIATQLDLHRCITKMPHTKRECYERTRLYFLVYLCDHHCSLTYGRPPMTREMRSLKSPGAFLRSEFSTHADLKLISQVELWSISRDVFEHFGADIESPIVSHRSAELERLSDAYDKWYQDWLDVLTTKDGLESPSRRLFDLYFHSAKLYLFSHVFRGRPQGNANSTAGSNETDKLAHHALSIVQCILDRTDAHPWLENLPSYFGTMIAFASVCLIRTSLQEQAVSDMVINETLGYLLQLAEVLRTSSMVDNPTHPLQSIAKSLELATIAQRRSSHEQSDEMNDEDLFDVPIDFDLFTSDFLNSGFPGDKHDWTTFPEQSGLPFPEPGHF